MTAPLEVLRSASGALKILSKVRCVDSYSFIDDVKYKVIHPWPSKFEKSKETQVWLKTNGIQVNEKLRVKAYPVDYSDYETRPVITTPRLTEIRAERSVISCGIIATQWRNIEKNRLHMGCDRASNQDLPRKYQRDRETKKILFL